MVTSAVSGMRAFGWGVGGMALVGTGVAALAAVVARRAGWSRDLAPEEFPAAEQDAQGAA
jgi:AAA family ATP:ADP antiporter